MRNKGVALTPDLIAGAVAATLLVVAMIFGGGSRGTGDAVVHLFAVPALWLGVMRWRRHDATGLQRAFLYLFLAAIGVALLQLLPLPASWIGALPLRHEVLADLAAAGMHSAWLPMSLDPWATARALLAIASTLAMWLLCCTLPTRVLDRLLALAAILAVPMVLLGFAQVAGGNRVDLHVHAFQNTGTATALFANRNHFASMLAMLLPVAMVLAHGAQRAHHKPAAFAWYATVVLLLLGAAMTFSRTGVLLAAVAAAATGAMLLLSANGAATSWPRRHAGMALTLLVAGVAVANYAWSRIIDRFDKDPLGDRRWDYIAHGWTAIKGYLPWGSGLGTFRDTYAPFEPIDAMINNYALHAHNELVEIALETGLVGLALIAAFLALLLLAVRRGLISRPDGVKLPVAAAIAITVPVAHGLVDYPLRTLTVSVVFALLLARVLLADNHQAFTTAIAEGPHARS
ncbi:O-antigen ligase family protein [Lysobacter sp. A03]|uniref:O-antigen ligase family protein n=1 Tax=Lysobacter sp. A03 TaxID=1199154 RepID=UPI0005B7230C|nr:O-antigen ligase family protein [Lysobacter sp. A03]KIQ97497.1 putative binding-protein-dependent transport system protein [Lysobacter sp. A03]